MAKQQVSQRYILKIHSGDLKASGWDYQVSIAEAKAKKEKQLISLMDSQVLRWIDELNGDTDREPKIRELHHRIHDIKKEPSGAKNRKSFPVNDCL